MKKLFIETIRLPHDSVTVVTEPSLRRLLPPQNRNFMITPVVICSTGRSICLTDLQKFKDLLDEDGWKLVENAVKWATGQEYEGISVTERKSEFKEMLIEMRRRYTAAFVDEEHLDAAVAQYAIGVYADSFYVVSEVTC